MKRTIDKADVLLSSILYAVYMLLSCIAMMVVEILIVDLLIGKIITTFVTLTPFVIHSVRALIYTVGVNAILGVMLYREGYKNAEYNPLATALSGIAATLMHFLVCLLFGFQAFCAGGVRSITAIIRHDLHDVSFTAEITRQDCIAVFFVNAAVYITVMVVLQMLGAKRRLSDREELTSATKDQINPEE